MEATDCTRREALALTGGLASAVVAGCLSSADGDDEPPEDAGSPGTPAESVQVTTTSRPYPKFEPQIVHVEAGGTVEWLVETGRHDVTAYHRDQHPPHHTPEGVAPWGSDRMTGAGTTYEHTFETAGVYDYVDTQHVCVAHEVAGNVGRVVVGWPDPDGEPAMVPPDEDLPSRVRNAFQRFNDETRPVLEAGP